MMHLTQRIFSVLLICMASASSAKSSADADDQYIPNLSMPPLQLFVDVDNCLYREHQLSRGIESQIIHGVKAFCSDRCNLNGAQADGLYELFGSTEEGLRRTVWRNTTIAQLGILLKQYYDTSYAKVDVSELLPSRQLTSTTGYSHSVAQQRTIRKVLAASPSLVTLSSNSPLFHVRKVIQALGLCRLVDGKEILSPDNCASSHVPTASKDTIFPTKVSPTSYFGKLKYPKDQVALVDDSSNNLKAVRRFMKGYRVSEKQSLLEALAKSWGWLDENYEFSPVEYLRAKNKMDELSMNRDTWLSLMENVASEIQRRNDTSLPLVIVDLGAGLLSMHRLLLDHEEEETTRNMPNLMSILESNGLSENLKKVHYVAYEPNKDLKKPCIEYLLERGYSLEQEYAWDSGDARGHVEELIFVKNTQKGMHIEVSLRFWDFRRHVVTTRDKVSPDLIVGCCFADLLPPDDLTRSILRLFLNKPRSHQKSTLVYLPITFWGVTQFVPSLPAAVNGTKVTPSDTQAFAEYSKVLENDFEHYLDPEGLIQSIISHGGCLISRGPSDWVIDATDHKFLWRTMLYFFGTGIAPELQVSGYDAASWIRRAWILRQSIRASNVDILMRLPYVGKWEENSRETTIRDEGECKDTFQEIEFSAPKQVAFVPRYRPGLGPGEIRVKSLCSLISSGTELKIFHGSFDDAALDVNFDSMEGQRMSFPLAYGYSLVGRVTECGQGVDDESLNGKLVFTFSAHASEVVVQADSVHLVPEGIDPFDAIFMPSVETALSIVHDAQPRLGEKLVVFGQGLIGLLVTSLLSSMALSLQFPSLTTVDTIPERLALSAWLGSQQAVSPSEVSACDVFDVAIEASGNYRALQSAIDRTRNGGRVIIASWYGSEYCSLKLGIDFHRSHKTIRTSQVSELPAELRETWTKQRRFDVVWHILKDLRPSRLLTRKAAPNEAKQMYEELSRGEQVSVAFDYTKS